LKIATKIVLYPRKNNEQLLLKTGKDDTDVAIQVETSEHQCSNIFEKTATLASVDSNKG